MAIGVDLEGNSVLAWQSADAAGSDTDPWAVHVRRFDPSGRPLDTTEFQANTVTTSWQRAPAVAMDLEGNFVVVWESRYSAGDDSLGMSIQGRRFRGDGREAHQNEYWYCHRRHPSVRGQTAPPAPVVRGVLAGRGGSFSISRRRT